MGTKEKTGRELKKRGETRGDGQKRDEKRRIKKGGRQKERSGKERRGDG